MQMLYNSDNYAVVQFEVPGAEDLDIPTDDVRLQAPPPAGAARPMPWMTRGGYEIVDKTARREIFIEGALAERFEAGVKDLIDGEPSEEDIDAFLDEFAAMAQHPVRLH